MNLRVWGCESQTIPKPIRGSPNRFGDQYIPIPKRGSPNRFGDCSVTNQKRFGVRSNLGTDRTRPQIKRDSKRGPHIGSGIPESVWVGICQNSKFGDPRTSSGFIPIWGPTYMDDVAASAIGSEPDSISGWTSPNDAAAKLTRSALMISILAKNDSSKNNSAYSVNAVKGM